AIPWGVFSGLLGLRTDELILVAARRPGLRTWPTLTDVQPIEEFVGTPTARPLAPVPQETPGIYVFRQFEIAAGDVDEFVRLSAEAWESFENDTAYRAEPRALLRGDSSEEATHMLLVTWYDGLASWERSRQPPAAARANFLARARLTRWALPIATRLVQPPA
ncbi:hypothetical protein, partial [Tepidiforma sp.]|uniref:hypothetical protein n=1 Tax=Tepidiforma sp. TaxID=2682230 RepID=UPI002ADE7BCB